jgi:hypothetical protein
MREMRRGTLRLLACAGRGRYHDDAMAIGWTDAPPGFDCWGMTLGDTDLGDYECKPLPSIMPQEPGLWLLTWEWQEVPHPEHNDELDDEGWEPDTTARYADTCEWRRPTIDDLASLGALPPSPPSPSRAEDANG